MESGHFSLNTTAISRDLAWLSSVIASRLESLDLFGLRDHLELGRRPVVPDVVAPQHHEPEQHLSSPPLVPHLLQEASHLIEITYS